MKKILHLALLLNIAISCNAMEQKSDISKTATLSAILTKRPESIIGLLHKTVAVLSDDGCNLYNYVTGEKITEFKKFDGLTLEQYISAHPDKTKLAFYRANNTNPLTPDFTFEIYDLITNQTIWNNSGQTWQEWQGAPEFNPHNDTIFIGKVFSGMESYNYTDNSTQTYNPFNRKDGMSCQTQLRFHPTKQEMIFLANSRYELPILQFDNEPLIKQMISTGCVAAGDCIFNAKYSPDGSLIAIIHQIRECSLFDLTTNINHFLDQNAAAVVFHPTKPFLALLTQNGKSINFYNTNTKKLTISSSTSDDYFNNQIRELRAEPISFSPGGDKMFIAIPNKDKVLIIDVPPLILNWDKK